jgi:hypothetical protein
MEPENATAGRLVEILHVTGTAESVMAAHVMAYAGIRQVLGGDNEESWALARMTHAMKPGVGVEFAAEFHRRSRFEESDGS